MTHPTESPTCPECGASCATGLTCRDMLGGIIAWEWQDPELMAEHFLTVAAYNLQHPAQFTVEAISGLKSVFIERLDHNLPIAEIRRRVGQAAEGKTRVRKKDSERNPVLRHWPMTIADVYLPDHPEGAAARVRAWAAAIRDEL